MKKTLFLCLITLLSTPLMAQKNMSPELLWQLKRLNVFQINDYDQSVICQSTSYNIAENKSNKEFFTVSLKGKNKSTLSTDIQEIIDTDDKTGKITYLKDGQIWMMGADGSAARQISHFDGKLENVKLSPDKKHILFTKEVQVITTLAKDRHADLKKADAYVFNNLNYRHWDTWEDGKFSHVFYASYQEGKIGKALDIMIDEPYDCPQRPFGGKEDIIWSPDSKSILYVTKKKLGKDYATSTNTDIYQYLLNEKHTLNISSGMAGYDTQPAFSPNGKLLAWTSMEEEGYEADKNDIWIFDSKNNRCENLTKSWDGTVNSFLWSKSSDKIYFLAYYQGTEQLFALNLEDISIKMLTRGQWDISSLVGQTDHQLLVTRTDMNHAADLFSVDISSGTIHQLTFLNKEIYDQLAFSKIEERWTSTSDGKKMLSWVIYPPGFDPDKQYPTLLYCQGGPQSALSQFYSFRWNFQLMAAQGYIVIAPNRRGMPGFGVEWNEQISGDWGGQAIKDYLAAIDDLAKEPYVDKKRLGAVGASYGGYSIYMLAGVHENRFRTFIAHDGLFDFRSWYGTTEELWFANKDLGGAFWDDPVPKSYQSFNPIEYVNHWNTPIMIIQGGKDFRVPVEQGLQAFQAAQLKGIKSRLLYFPEENHWVLSPQNALVWQREFFTWLDETL